MAKSHRITSQTNNRSYTKKKKHKNLNPQVKQTTGPSSVEPRTTNLEPIKLLHQTTGLWWSGTTTKSAGTEKVLIRGMTNSKIIQSRGKNFY